MPDFEGQPERIRKIFLVVLALSISALFLWMIRGFLVVMLLAALSSALSYPLYRRLLKRLKGRATLASALTIAIGMLVAIVPLAAFGTLVTLQAIQLSQEAGPWLSQKLGEAKNLDGIFESYPELARLSPYRTQILQKAAELSSMIGGFVVAAVAAAARETATFFFLLFVLLYSTFFFLINGRAALQKILYYLPLPPEDENQIVGRFVSVARATLKGTFVIGLVQGALGGMAFWVAGIQGAALWAAAMGVLSIIPGLGPVIVWLPAVIFLMAMGRFGAAAGLALWCAAVVGTVDNFLRPWLVGKDTKMPDLLILLSTLGGIVMFGAVGFIIGPIIAALFVTIWEIYGQAFRGILPEPTRLSIPPSSSGPRSERVEP
jgi:predicted PurR-regulated permease PerM